MRRAVMRRAVMRRAVTRRTMMRRTVVHRAVMRRLVLLSRIRTSKRCGREGGQGSNLRCVKEYVNPPLDPVLGELIELSENK